MQQGCGLPALIGSWRPSTLSLGCAHNDCLSVDEFASELTDCLSVDEFATQVDSESNDIYLGRT
jgi:hypothetical protein